MKITPNNNSEIKELLYFYLNYYGSYHSQKETTVWAGLAIYISIISTIIGFAHNQTFYWRDAVLLSLFSLVMGIFVNIFLHTQLSAKFIAATVVDAAHNLILKVLDHKLENFDFENSTGDLNRYPKTVADEINQVIENNSYIPPKSNIIYVFTGIFHPNSRQKKVEHFVFSIFWICQIVLMSIWWKEIIIKAL